MKLSLVTLPGDGVGPEVVAEAMKVLEVVASRFDHELDAKPYPFGSSGLDEAQVPRRDRGDVGEVELGHASMLTPGSQQRSQLGGGGHADHATGRMESPP